MTQDIRISVRLAADHLRTGGALNMGDTMDLLGCARTTEEAEHLRTAYVDALCLDGESASEARELCDENIKFGSSYMGMGHLLDLYFPGVDLEGSNDD